MKEVEEKYEPILGMTGQLRALRVKYGYLIADLDKRPTLQAIASKLKKKEGKVFQTRKVGDELHIWRLK